MSLHNVSTASLENALDVLNNSGRATAGAAITQLILEYRDELARRAGHARDQRETHVVDVRFFVHGETRLEARELVYNWLDDSMHGDVWEPPLAIRDQFLLDPYTRT